MLRISTLALLSLTSTSLAWEWGRSGKWNSAQRTTCHSQESTINYTTITGFFQQDESSTVPGDFDYTESNYGLIDRSYPTDDEFDPSAEKTQWERFEYYVNTLNRDCDKNTKLLGHPCVERNGTAVWRDAHLTPAGLAQCTLQGQRVLEAGPALATAGIPAPQSYYSSPLIRFRADGEPDLRRPGAAAAAAGGSAVRAHGQGGAPPRGHLDAHVRTSGRAGRASRPSWARPSRSSPASPRTTSCGAANYEGARRPRRSGGAPRPVLDDVFSADDATWVSITSHSGQIRENLAVLGHRTFSLSTGQGHHPGAGQGCQRQEEGSAGRDDDDDDDNVDRLLGVGGYLHDLGRHYECLGLCVWQWDCLDYGDGYCDYGDGYCDCEGYSHGCLSAAQQKVDCVV
ncbi:hypothetical protein F4778DRAFT_783753 [Xylariomycetidae sp. FL2044]|nr:hypothetical protein F4778DRAFT_783753 [Xylariomycetidae sp. FL2044]